MKIFRQSPIPPDSVPFNRLEFYKENYYKEIERRNSLTNEIGLLGTVMIALVSGVYVLFTSFKNPIPCITLIFNLLVAVDLYFILGTGYHLLSSYYKFSTKGRTSLLLPRLKVMEGYYDVCKDPSHQDEFENYLKDQFITLSDQLVESNNDKSRDLTKSASWMTSSFKGAAVLIVCFLVNYTAEPFITRFIKNTKEIHTAKDNNEQRPKSVKTGAGPTTDTARSATNANPAPAPGTTTRKK
ncbi:hypothetical protein [Dyadobacter bucti]|uniref:hypothetical protein n=1 Tax=Dyadobacter bucti TaxID=2572203 RepID=UPI0011091383|nr:hypothetical protein [Dyadobacter bucti]